MNEDRYQEPNVISKMVKRFLGDNGVQYCLCYNDSNEVVLVALFDGINIFTAPYDYVLANKTLHAMTDGKMVDHEMDERAWYKMREYFGYP